MPLLTHIIAILLGVVAGALIYRKNHAKIEADYKEAIEDAVKARDDYRAWLADMKKKV